MVRWEEKSKTNHILGCKIDIVGARVYSSAMSIGDVQRAPYEMTKIVQEAAFAHDGIAAYSPTPPGSLAFLTMKLNDAHALDSTPVIGST